VPFVSQLCRLAVDGDMYVRMRVCVFVCVRAQTKILSRDCASNMHGIPASDARECSCAHTYSWIQLAVNHCMQIRLPSKIVATNGEDSATQDAVSFGLCVCVYVCLCVHMHTRITAHTYMMNSSP
jgi:hypothetical protein